ncbi:MAG TPA: hypothetical protein VLE96_03835 [Chlamydiales bacterium]|nr:hypothetical protein [Chlamydiales bacterium]
MKTWGMIALLFFVSILASCSKGHNRCGTRQACSEDSRCKCWCSQSCSFRPKHADDHPTYVDNDPNGKFCYCKEWDMHHYKDNCIHKMQVKEPKGAK